MIFISFACSLEGKTEENQHSFCLLPNIWSNHDWGLTVWPLLEISTKQGWITAYRDNVKGYLKWRNPFEHHVLSAGLTGQFCEINIDDCDKQPCGVLSICKDTLNGYNCFCAPGFIGKWKLSWSHSLWVSAILFAEAMCQHVVRLFILS